VPESGLVACREPVISCLFITCMEWYPNYLLLWRLFADWKYMYPTWLLGLSSPNLFAYKHTGSRTRMQDLHEYDV